MLKLETGDGFSLLGSYFDFHEIVLWWIGEDHTAQILNRERAMELGFDVEALELNAAGKRDSLIHHDDLETVKSNWTTALAGNTPVRVEHRLLMRDGTFRWVESRAEPVIDGQKRLGWRASTTDIHLRKVAELERFLAEERLRAALSGTEAAAWELNCSSGEHWASDDRCVPGFLLLPEAIQGAEGRCSIHPDDHDAIRRAYQLAIVGETDGIDVDYRAAQPGSAWCWISDKGRVVSRLSTGEALSIVGQSLNITERKRDEERQLLAQRAGRAGLYDVDLRTGEVIVSGAFFDLYGFSRRPKVWSRETWLAHVHEADRVRVQEYLTSIVANRQHDSIIDYRIVRADGSVRWTRSRTCVECSDGEQPVRAYGVQLDITEQKEAEIALAAREAELSVIFDQTLIGILHRRLDGTLLYVNRRLCDIFGVTPEALSRSDWRALIRSDDETETQQLYEMHEASGEPLVVERPFVRPDGREIWCRVQVSFVRGPDGAILSRLGAVDDITEAKRAEEERNRLRSRLEQATRLLTAGAMGATLSHELQQPHAAAVNYQAASLVFLRQGQIEEATSALVAAQQQVMRAGEIVRRMKDFVSLGRPSVQATSLNEIVAGVLACVPPSVRQRVMFDATEGGLELVADPVQIQQVLANLVRNAADADRRSGKPIKIDSRVEGAMAEIRVIDEGPGLSSDIAEDLFELFATSKQDGLGLGLAMCRMIVEAHGGKITLRNWEKGAMALVSLPVANDRGLQFGRLTSAASEQGFG